MNEIHSGIMYSLTKNANIHPSLIGGAAGLLGGATLGALTGEEGERTGRILAGAGLGAGLGAGGGALFKHLMSRGVKPPTTAAGSTSVTAPLQVAPKPVSTVGTGTYSPPGGVPKPSTPPPVGAPIEEVAPRRLDARIFEWLAGVNR